MNIPVTGTYPLYFHNYIKLVNAPSIAIAIDTYSDQLHNFWNEISEEKSAYCYAENKWSIKEVLQHIIDGERIFMYRALSLARGEQAALPGFEENDYAACSNADEREWQNLIEEFRALRKSTDLMLLSFNDRQLKKSGIINGQPNTVIAIAYIIIGHALHHVNILNERYLS